MRKPRSILLVGGPFDGRRVIALGKSTLAIEGDPLPDGQVARYRPSRTPDRYTYRGLATVLARVGEKAA